MATYKDLLKEHLIAELKLCQEIIINHEQLDYAISQNMSELYKVQVQGCIAEYFLIRGDYEKAKYHSKKYRNMLKELL